MPFMQKIVLILIANISLKTDGVGNMWYGSSDDDPLESYENLDRNWSS